MSLFPRDSDPIQAPRMPWGQKPTNSSPQKILVTSLSLIFLGTMILLFTLVKYNRLVEFSEKDFGAAPSSIFPTVDIPKVGVFNALIPLQEVKVGTLVSLTEIVSLPFPSSKFDSSLYAQNLRGIEHKYALENLPAGKMIELSKLTLDPPKIATAIEIPVGYRALTISPNAGNAGGGDVQPGSIVDLSVEIPVPGNPTAATPQIAESLLVLAMGDQNYRRTLAEDDVIKNAEPTHITLAVPKERVPEIVFFTQAQYKLSVNVRNSEDLATYGQLRARTSDLLAFLKSTKKKSDCVENGYYAADGIKFRLFCDGSKEKIE